MTFKVGDKVRMKDTAPDWAGVFPGDIVEFVGYWKSVSSPEYYCVVRGGNASTSATWVTSSFELVKPGKTPHKHAALIKAWADGVPIQFKSSSLRGWQNVTVAPGWFTDCEYRIKPEPKPDVVISTNIVKAHIVDIYARNTGVQNCKFTFDGETGKLKAVELINKD